MLDALPLGTLVMMLFVLPAFGEEPYDSIWSHATVYETIDNRFVPRFSLSGRLQADYVYFDGDQGDSMTRAGVASASAVLNRAVRLEGDVTSVNA